MTAQQMAGEFQKSIDFFLASHPDTTIGKIYLSGGSARVPPLLAGDRAARARAGRGHGAVQETRSAAPNIDPAFLRNHGPQAMVRWGSRSDRPGDKFE